VHITGVRGGLPAAVDLAAYRIIQESLTNTIRHAGPARAVVSLHYGHDRLDVEVCDDGHGPAPDADPGLGLVGMRERAASIGGTFVSGAGADGGFRVAARLPIRREQPP
jgi:signal transduction histidine kinase